MCIEKEFFPFLLDFNVSDDDGVDGELTTTRKHCGMYGATAHI